MKRAFDDRGGRDDGEDRLRCNGRAAADRQHAGGTSRPHRLARSCRLYESALFTITILLLGDTYIVIETVLWINIQGLEPARRLRVCCLVVRMYSTMNLRRYVTLRHQKIFTLKHYTITSSLTPGGDYLSGIEHVVAALGLRATSTLCASFCALTLSGHILTTSK